MRYLDKSFSVHVGGDKYREGWEAVFGKKPPRGTMTITSIDRGAGTIQCAPGTTITLTKPEDVVEFELHPPLSPEMAREVLGFDPEDIE